VPLRTALEPKTLDADLIVALALEVTEIFVVAKAAEYALPTPVCVALIVQVPLVNK
jgi:hypothetical protein